MTLESLVEEIRRRGAADVAAIEEEERTAVAAVAADGAQRRAAVAADAARATDLEIARERAQRLAGAKLEARKALYEARERRLARSVEATRGLLADFTRSPAYATVLQRMYAAATDELGKTARIRGRAEDAPTLQKLAGKAFDAAPVAIVGGLLAATPNGDRRLNLSFDELLRMREDRVRELLA